MAGMSCGEMVEPVSGGAWPRRGANRCHQGKPLVVTENSLLLHTAVPLGTHTRCWRWSCHLHPQLALAPIAPQGFSTSPAPERQLEPVAASCTRCRRWPHSHPLLAPGSATPNIKDYTIHHPFLRTGTGVVAGATLGEKFHHGFPACSSSKPLQDSTWVAKSGQHRFRP
ncbi:hypothetical protein MDA_GLEAN10013511 [Myotis davidii]|uniref:Uncharacterized protein n=1 Tax=Myotis davidii TaxID=225400 RepID=L5MHT9_MYODS|nr:hypothetical protein MDA_GLEAN10013511 [Myotis davidii]